MVVYSAAGVNASVSVHGNSATCGPPLESYNSKPVSLIGDGERKTSEHSEEFHFQASAKALTSFDRLHDAVWKIIPSFYGRLLDRHLRILGITEHSTLCQGF